MGIGHADEMDFGRVSRIKGRVFEILSFASSVFGILMLGVLLVYVLIDALSLEQASPEWLLTYFLTLVVPMVGFFLYSANDPRLTKRTVLALGGGLVGTAVGVTVFEAFVRPIPALSWQLVYLFGVVVPTVAYVGFVGSREPVGRVGLGLAGRLAGGAGLGIALVFIFVIFSELAWFWAYTFGLLPAAGIIRYSQTRQTSSMSMFTVPVVLAGFVLATNAKTAIALQVYLAVLSLPALVLIRDGRALGSRRDSTIGGIALLVTVLGGSASALFGFAIQDAMRLYLGFPTPWMTYVWTLAIPLSVVIGVGAAKESGRLRGFVVGGFAFLLVVGGSQAATFAGYGADNALLFLVTIGVPTVTYVRRTVEEGDGIPGLGLPVLGAAGIVTGSLVSQQFAFAAPDPWLDYSFLTSITARQPELAGFYPAIVGSILIIAMVAVFSFILALGTAVFLEEYTPDGGIIGSIARIVQINIANLAAVPSVVYGLLGLGVFINLIGFGAGTALTAAITLSLLILPITIIAAQEAIRSVPDSLRNGSYAMGATRWQTTKNVVLPEAMPGILTGTILALGRAIGETAPLIMIGVPNTVFNAPNGIRETATAMPMQIFVWAGSAQSEFRHGVLAAAVVTLLVVLLGMNATAILIRNRSEQQT